MKQHQLKPLPKRITKSWIYKAYWDQYTLPDLREKIDAVYKDVFCISTEEQTSRKRIIPRKVFNELVKLIGLPNDYKMDHDTSNTNSN